MNAIRKKKNVPILSVRDLKVHFSLPGKGFFGAERQLKAVDGIDFDLYPGETLGIVGESGCGKSTLGRAILQLIPPTNGQVVWLGRDIVGAPHFSGPAGQPEPAHDDWRDHRRAACDPQIRTG